MKRRLYKKNEQYILYVVIGVMIVAGIFTFFSQKSLDDTLDVYSQSDKVENKVTESDESPDIILTAYTDEKNGYSIGIPEGWQKVIKNGYTTFVHSPSASSLQIQILDYDPKINNISSDSISTDIAEKGNTFVSFNRSSTSSYEVTYQDFKNSTYDYIEEVYWDQSKIIKLVCTFNDANYQKIKPYYEKIIKSFSWNREKEIPSDYYLFYNDNAKFEVGIPASWTVSQANDTIVAMNEDSNASESITVLKNSSYLDKITVTDMTNLLKSGKSGFIMKSYDNKKKKASIVYTYISGSQQITSQTYVYANGTYLYFVSFDYVEGTLQDNIPEDCSNLFREFIKDK